MTLLPHQNGKRDQARRHFRKLCREIPQKPTGGKIIIEYETRQLNVVADLD